MGELTLIVRLPFWFLRLLTLCLPGFGVLGIRLQVDIGIHFSGRLALLARCRLPC